MEKTVEKKFRDGCLAMGCRSVKFIDPVKAGGPDRMVMISGGLMIFVEIKDPGKKPRKSQISYMMDLNFLGFLAFWSSDADEALKAIRTIKDHTERDEFVAGLCTRQLRLLERQL